MEPVELDQAPERFSKEEGDGFAVEERDEKEATWIFNRSTLLVFLAASILIVALLLGEDYLPAWTSKPIAVAMILLTFLPILVYYLGGTKLRAKARRRLFAVRLGPEVFPSSGRSVVGTARRLDDHIRARLTNEPCLVAHLELKDSSGAKTYLRTLRKVELVLELESGERVILSGELVLDAASNSTGNAKEARQIAQQLGFWPRYELPAMIAMESLVREGDTVEAWGELGSSEGKCCPQLADSYRSGGLARVIRGLPGRPILIRVRT